MPFPDPSPNRHGLSVRGDMLYCPLSLSLDAYWNCLTDCRHCYLRRLNEVWGKDLRPANTLLTKKKLTNGLKNNNPKTPLAWALKNKTTIRLGNKADPFQPVERQHRTSSSLMSVLIDLKWQCVIQTMHTDIMMDYKDILIKNKDLFIVQTVISPGLDFDWEALERKRTTPPMKRLRHLQQLKRKGVFVGAIGEPFIPGYHSILQFEEVLKLLKSFGIRNYNVYNFHFNAFVAKRLAAVGIDIEKIWEENQDLRWQKTLQQLLCIAKDYDIILGCPDFVNSGWNHQEQTNTCCGINVKHPTTFNIPTWKRLVQKGKKKAEILDQTWDGIGNFVEGKKAYNGKLPDQYTLKDIID